ncbi:MAG: multicomponent Na+:H+ antiporter subunit, partial [Pseudonocardiales bacterium]|nr:multicomponent Na+:H+ antiporter subunit [Pseudonocardiales bacterium]
MTVFAYGVAGWLLLLGAFGIAVSRDIVRSVVCLSVAQSGTYVLLIAVGYQKGAAA